MELRDLMADRIRAAAARLGQAHRVASLRAVTGGRLHRWVDFFYQVAEEEHILREDHRLWRALRNSKLPHHKTLDDYDFSRQPELDARKVHRLTAMFAQAKVDIAVIGPAGSGKTHLAVAFAVAACQSGYSIHFTTLADMVDRLKADTAGRLASAMRLYLRPQVLVLDAVGTRPLAKDEADLALQILHKRHGQGSTLLTSSNATSEWAQVFADLAPAGGILDQFTRRCEVITLNSPAARLAPSAHAPHTIITHTM